MKKRKALGKGLSSLIPEGENKGFSSQLKEVDIDLLMPNEYQPRKKFKKESLEKLSESIKEHGILQPIVVREREDGKFEIIAGERRLRAALLSGLKKVPVVVKDSVKGNTLELALVENLNREDLSPIEEAEALNQLHSEFGLTHEEISRKIGKSRGYVTNMIRMLSLPDEIKELLESEVLSIGQVRPLLTIEDRETQIKLAKEIVKRSLNSREVEKLIKRLKSGKKSKRKLKDPFIESAEEKLMQVLATRVTIDKSKRGGKIIIKFSSEEELERLYEILTGER